MDIVDCAFDVSLSLSRSKSKWSSSLNSNAISPDSLTNVSA